MTAYYNEIDPYAAQWLRNLIEAGHIAHGIVDDRSIEDVPPGDLRGFTQCHWFAGIAVWSYALRRAGWPDDRPVWTGSCPCQPFSAAGKGAGFADERHLWPAFFHLIGKCRPEIILGEQVASKDAGHWIDLVHADVESVGYAFGAVPFPASSVGAPHIRDRLYWVADTTDKRLHGWRTGKTSDGRDAAWFKPERLCDVDGLGHSTSQGLQGGEQPRKRVDAQQPATQRAGEAGGLGHSRQNHDSAQGQAAGAGQSQADRSADQFGGPGVPLGGLGLANSNGCEQGRTAAEAMGHGNPTYATGSNGGLADTVMQQRPNGKHGSGDVDDASGRHQGAAEVAGLRGDLRPGPVNGFWRDADWLLCRDGKFRPVEPGTFPLVDGAPARVGRLRAYGNAICAEAARVFIESVMEAA